jgi:hypothetical protein
VNLVPFNSVPTFPMVLGGLPRYIPQIEDHSWLAIAGEFLWTALPTNSYATTSSLAKPIKREVTELLRLRDLLRSYVVKSSAPIVRFLRSRPQLVSVLEDARSALPLYFQESMLVLDLVYDGEEDWERLYLIVKTKMDVEALLTLSDRFHNEWVIPRIDSFGGEFSVTEELL